MKPDAWMPFYGDDFFSAVQMWDNGTVAMYVRCLWFYWSHAHCEGLPNDDDQLRTLCRCDMGEWGRTKGRIFDGDKFFVLDGGKWHQKRCRSEYQKAEEVATNRSEVGRLGAKTRWSKEAGSIAASTAAGIAKAIAGDVANTWQNDAQPQPQPHSHLNPPEQPQSHAPVVCATDDVYKTLEGRIGELYKRGANEHWTYAEQTALAEVVRRAGALDEFDHILALRRSMPPDDRKRFFPQSVYSLLSKWNETLDKARIQCPTRGVKKAAPAPRAVPSDSSPEVLRDAIKHLEKNNPKSPMLKTFRDKLAAFGEAGRK